MITLPNKPKIIKEKGNEGIFEVEACYPGYGITLGNAFRRVLLSSLPGVAITGIKIKGVQHEFSTIKYVMEDMVQIILNLKQVRFKLHNNESIKTKLKVSGNREAKAGDIKATSDLEIINKDFHIATLTDKKAELEIELEIESGLGYSPIEERKKEKIEIGRIAIDAIFSPIRRVNYSIENMRVGEKTNYDKIRFNIQTDGTISPRDAFVKTAKILVDHYNIFAQLEKPKKTKKKIVKLEKKKEKKNQKLIKKVKKVKEVKDDLGMIKTENLKISSRTIVSLQTAGIKTVKSLIKKNISDLEGIDGMGDKGILEVKRALGKLGLTLK